jgi:hypothetical protein
VARRSLNRKQILALLADNPRRIEALTSGVSPSRLKQAPPAGGWCVNDVLAHLRSCADVWTDCIVTIAVDDHPTIRAVNPDTWIESTDYRELDFLSSWRSYSDQRSDLLAFLEALAEPAWTRTATVTGAGAAIERTVHFYAQWLASHERSHVTQIERLLRT